MFQGEYCGRRFDNGNRYVELCVSIELFVSELNCGPLLDYAAAHMKNGQRVSPDTVKLKKLLDPQSLSLHDYDVLWDNYLKARYGEQIHEYVINISTDLEYALIFRDRDTYKLFGQLFLQKKKNCRRMIRRIPTGLNFLQNFDDNRPSSTDIYTIGSLPCFGMFHVNDLLKKYCTPVSPEIFSLISNFFTENQKFYRQEEFHMITEIKSGKYKAYLLDTEKFLYPPELTISAFNLTEANIIYLSPEVEARFTIEEQSLTRIIYNFLEELKVSMIVFGSEETVAWLESTYAAYKNTGN